MSLFSTTPRVTVIVLNYNGRQWLQKCVDSLKTQTIFNDIEVIMADNASTDGSDIQGAELMKGWSNGFFLQNGANLGFAEGNNRPAKSARGKFLFFLNNDAWLEPNCLEKLLDCVEREQAAAATPRVLNYDDNSFQSAGAIGFDIFGFATDRGEVDRVREILMPEGCSYLIRKDVFEAVGGFDREFFMYAEELDLSWRVWLAGHRIITVPQSIVHHRGAANVNPAGGGSAVEFRTSDSKRYYANRNALVTLWKNGENLILALMVLQILLLLVEAVVALLLVRRWSFVRKAYIEAFWDTWAMRNHIKQERARIRAFRKISDMEMFEHFRLTLYRWFEVKRMFKYGAPKVTAR